MPGLSIPSVSNSSSRGSRHRTRHGNRNKQRLFRPAMQDLEGRQMLAIDFWTGLSAQMGGNNNWSNPGNWSLNAVPGTSDTADFNSSQSHFGSATVDTAEAVGALDIEDTWGGTLTVSSPLSMSGNFTLSSGTVNGNGTISAAGNNSQWTGGTINFGTGTLSNSGTLTIATTTTPNHSLNLSGTLINTSNIVVTGNNTIYAQADGTKINNQAGGTFDFQDGASINSNGKASTAFNNAGVLERSTGSGTATISFPVNDSGTIAGNSGTLLLTGGGSGGPGMVNAGAGGTVILGGSFSGTLTGGGAGSVILSGFVGAGATLNFTGNVLEWANVQNGSHLDGTLTNKGNLAIVTTTTPNNSLNLTGTLTNSGHIVVTGTNTIYAQADGTTISNQAAGTFDFQDAAVLNSNGKALTAFSNAGILERTAGSGTATIWFPVTDSGTIEGDSGTLLLTGGGSGAPGAVNAGASGTVILGGSFSGTLTGAGAGSVILSGFVGSGATLNFTGNVLQWANVQNGSHLDGTVTNQGNLAIVTTTTPNNSLNLTGTLTNSGHIVVTGTNTVYAQADGTTISNQAAGTFDFQDATVLNSNGKASTDFINAGILERTAGSGTATISFPVTDSGTIEGDSGTLLLTGGGSGAPGAVNAAQMGRSSSAGPTPANSQARAPELCNCRTLRDRVSTSTSPVVCCSGPTLKMETSWPEPSPTRAP